MKTRLHHLPSRLSRKALTVWLWSIAMSGQGSDWPQYRGPNHDGVSTDKILKSWPTNGLPQLWKVSLTGGYSTFTVSQGRAYTLTLRSEKEVCLALSADTGAELWATQVGEAGAVAYSTPTIAENRVFVLTGDVQLICLDAQSGALVWKRNLLKEYHCTIPGYGSASSPALEGDYVFVNGTTQTNSLLAFYQHNGELAWQGQTGKPQHATPLPVTISGTRQILFYTQTGLVSVMPGTGALLWRYLADYWPKSMPVIVGDLVFTVDFGGSRAVRITRSGDKFACVELWSSRDLRSYWCTPVYYGGCLFELEGGLQCFDSATGKQRWAKSPLPSGGILVVDGKLLILSSGGTLVLADPNPDAYTELARIRALNGTCFNHPAIANGRVYARSDREAVCLDISEKSAIMLRLPPPRLQPNGTMQLALSNAAGSSLPSESMTNLAILASTNVTLPLTNWIRLASPAVFTNGAWQWDDPAGVGLPQRFYIGIGQP